MPPSVAATEIEETLRLARDEVEAQIASYRLGVFVAAVGITLVVQRVSLAYHIASTKISTVYFLGCVVYALALQHLVRRLGAKPWLTHVSLVLDLLASVGIVEILHFARVGLKEEHMFASHVVGVSLALNLMLNILRGTEPGAVAGAAFAAVLSLGVLVPIEGFHPALVISALQLLLMGAIGFAAARQGRRNLDRFARLQLLRRFLSPAAVERVMKDPTDTALSLGGELLTVTLLAGDLRGFTGMSESLPPADVVRQLNEFHGAMLEQIDAHAGVLDKFIGDGLLVVFGLERVPVAAGVRVSPDSRRAGDCGAAMAVKCAMAMQDALVRLNLARAGRSEPPLRMGIGVHTGPVVAGNIGAPGRRLEFTVIGDAVNTASRLEGMTKDAHTSMLVSASTMDRLGKDDAAPFREIGPVAVRGKLGEIVVFATAGEASVARASLHPGPNDDVNEGAGP